MRIDKKTKEELKKKLVLELKHPEQRRVLIKTADQLDDSVLTELKASLPFLKDARVETQVDESLIGGLVIFDGSNIFDLSVKGRLDEIISDVLVS